MNVFDKAFSLIVSNRVEGDFSNDPEDAGGKTKYGISQSSYPLLDINSLTLSAAKSIYKRDFWDRYFCETLPERLSIFYFDCTVNQGPDNAIRLLQQHLKITVDGTIGPVTLKAMKNAAPAEDNEFMTLRARKYTQTANYIDFGKGWFNRLFYLSINV